MFLDADYVSQYIQNTQTAALADLMLYRKSLLAATGDVSALEQQILKIQGKEEKQETTLAAYSS